MLTHGGSVFRLEGLQKGDSAPRDAENGIYPHGYTWRFGVWTEDLGRRGSAQLGVENGR